jgi:hypothetical protein
VDATATAALEARREAAVYLYTVTHVPPVPVVPPPSKGMIVIIVMLSMVVITALAALGLDCARRARERSGQEKINADLELRDIVGVEAGEPLELSADCFTI